MLTQDADPSGTTLVDVCNGLNELIRLSILWTVRHHWLTGARFALNFYRHWEQLLLCQPGEPPVTILIQEGVTHGDPLSMVFYGIPLAPLAYELRAVDGLLSPFYEDDAAFNSLALRSAQILKLLMGRGTYDGYLLEPDKSLLISDTLVQEETAIKEFAS